MIGNFACGCPLCSGEEMPGIRAHGFSVADIRANWDARIEEMKKKRQKWDEFFAKIEEVTHEQAQ